MKENRTNDHQFDTLKNRRFGDIYCTFMTTDPSNSFIINIYNLIIRLTSGPFILANESERPFDFQGFQRLRHNKAKRLYCTLCCTFDCTFIAPLIALLEARRPSNHAASRAFGGSFVWNR